ncbi:MAG: 50S ribosomal protein L39e [archaeon GB-1867-097]|nr:50S ribosomal protein L39e [Candidatus Culexmicrobium thermophilum]MCS7385075.1 50S ribosomal protein L39e [Candidatus Culexmicrobium thermophilum]
MAKHKPLGKKLRLSKALKQNSPVPFWVVVKTRGRFRRHPKMRNWRRSRLQL